MPKSLGFTLIELLIGIVIIGILAGIGIVAFSGIQKSARDAKRKAEVDSITKVWESKYNFAAGTYPAYEAILDSDFTTGTKPKESEAADYYNQVSAGSKAFIVCTNRLEKETQVYCKYSANGDVSALVKPAPYVASAADAGDGADTGGTDGGGTGAGGADPVDTTPALPSLPVGEKYVFVTSTTYDGNLGGLVGADAKCNERAQAGGVPGTYKAWLSSSTVSAASRIVPTDLNAKYRRLDNQIVADSWSDLTDGSLDQAINLNELLQVQDTSAWTNTRTNGDIRASYTWTACSDWSSSLSNVRSYVGKSRFTTDYWTINRDGWGDIIYTCQNSISLYCFQVD